MRLVSHNASLTNEYYDKGSEILPTDKDKNNYLYDLIEVEVYKIKFE